MLNLAVSGGYIKGIGGDEVHLEDRFFIGGATLRGFQYGGVGPRDKSTDDALGGNVYYVGTAEMRFPARAARYGAHLRAHLRRCRAR